MFTEKDLIAGETVLVSKDNPANKKLYLGNAGLVHFISSNNKYKITGGLYTIEELNEWYIIEQPKSKVVPLDKKVYDFVPVRVRDKEYDEWENVVLIAVTPEPEYPYKVINKSKDSDGFRYINAFLNKQKT